MIPPPSEKRRLHCRVLAVQQLIAAKLGWRGVWESSKRSGTPFFPQRLQVR